MVEHPGRSEAVPFPDTLLAVPHNPVADIDAVALEPSTDELPTQGNMLLVALRRVHPVAIFLVELLFAQGHMGEACFQVIHHPPHIVHETAVVHTAGIYLPMVKAIEVVVLLDLPELISEAGSSSVLPVEYHALSRLHNRLPFMLWGDQYCMLCRIGIDYAPQYVQQVVSLLSGLKALLDEPAVLLVAAVQVTRREIPLNIPRNQPAVPGVVARHLSYILQQSLYSFVWSVADTIVEGSVGQPLLDFRPHKPVKMELHHLAWHQTGDDLTRPRPWRYESVKKGGKGSVIDILKQPRQVSLPVQLKGHRVCALLLVRSAGQVVAIQCLQIHALQNNSGAERPDTCCTNCRCSHNRCCR